MTVRRDPEEAARFETDLRQALVAENPLADAERDQVDRARAGDLTGLRVRGRDGTWVTL